MESASWAQEHSSLVSAEAVPPATHPPAAARDMEPSSYQASSAQEPLVFPLSGPPVLVSFRVPWAQGCVRSLPDQVTGINFVQQTDEFNQRRTPAQTFYLEPSELHLGHLHVRCADGDKYWVAQEHDGAVFVAAAADTPEEDLSMPSCTLFQISGSGAEFLIKHKNQALGMYSLPGKLYMQIGVQPSSPENIAFRIVRLSDQKELPKYVLIKGSNGKYLSGMTPFAQAFLDADSHDPSVIYETFTDDYGLVRFKNYSWGNVFCRCLLGADNQYYVQIVPDGIDDIDTIISEDTIYKDVASLFKVVIKDGNHIALQSIISGKFCNLAPAVNYTDSNQLSILGAFADNTYPRETTFQIEEPVKSREIYDVQYRFGGKKTGNTVKASRQQVIATNMTEQTDYITKSVETFQKAESRWDAKLSLDVGIKATMKVEFPLLAEFQVESHVDFHGEYNWGETKLYSEKSMTQIQFSVPPMTKIICVIYSEDVEIDVPFSYKVKDVLFNGEEAPPRQMHDGICRGVHSIDVDIKTLPQVIEDI
ncbi:unnamed protein product [Alopecurus aequalis]